LAIWGAIHGWGPFANRSPEENAFSVQVFLILISLPLLTLAAVFQEQRHLKEVARKGEQQLEVALNATRRSEEELLELNRQIRALAGRLISAQETERRRMSRELHDELSQKVAALSVGISHLKRRLPDTKQQTIEALDSLYHDANDLTGHIRQLSHELHPATLEHLGLEKALYAYATQFEREEEIETSFTARVSSKSIPFEASVCLYRVAVEGLRNIAKHSQAQTASVSLLEEENQLILEIADSGRGFNIENARGGEGIGLISAEERIRLLQGRFVIKSDLSVGTTLIATVPLGIHESD
jgi:two-component system sensor histidine kinase UhpB